MTTADWDPTQSVSYSSLVKHRECPQAWSYRYLDGLESDRQHSVWGDFGTWFHLVKHAHSISMWAGVSLKYTPETFEIPGSKAVLTRVGELGSSVYSLGGGSAPITPDLILKLSHRVWAKQAEDYRALFVEKLGRPLPDHLERVYRSWVNRWSEDSKHQQTIAVEVKVKRPAPDGSGTFINGYVDEVYLDTRRSLVVARDAKTSSKLESDESASNLADSQLHLYSWALEPVLQKWGYSRVDAVEYDRVRSVAPSTPQVTKSGTLSASVTDFDLDTYLEWAKGPDGNGVPWGEEGEFFKSGKNAGHPKFGLYTAEDKEIAKRSTPAARDSWTRRTLMPVNPNVVQAHLQSAMFTREDAERTMIRYRETGIAPRNFTRRGCQMCDFKRLCSASMLGGIDGEYSLSEMGLRKREDKV